MSKQLLSIIAAALVSGAAYAGGPFVGPGMEPSNRLWEQEQARQVHEQLEEIQAQQRQIRAAQSDAEMERWNRQLEMQRYLRNYLEDCE